MIKLIIGNKGSGKTKKLLELINKTAESSKGDVVCIEKGDVMTYNVSYKVRLIDAASYGISGYNELYGLLCGICSSNHDLTNIFVDATLRIGSRDMNELAAFLDRLTAIAEEFNICFVFTVSCAVEDIPPHVLEIAEQI